MPRVARPGPLCKTCGNDNPDDFMPSRRYKCRECHRKYQSAHYWKDPEHSRYIRREWQNQYEHREANRQRCARWREENRLTTVKAIKQPPAPTASHPWKLATQIDMARRTRCDIE